jgi:hypothetical protein
MKARLSEKNALTSYDFDPDATTATNVAFVDMRDFSGLLVQVFRTIGTSVMTLKVVGSAASDGSNPIDIKTKTFTAGQPDAVGDYVSLDVTDNEILAASETIRYVSAVVSVATGTDEAVVIYLREGKNKRADLTTDLISA